MDAEFDQLKREFLAEADAKAAEIDTLMASELSPDSVERIIYLAHQLKGAGGSYGFSRISVEAAAVETALEKNDQRAASRDALKAKVQSLREEIRTRSEELSVSA